MTQATGIVKGVKHPPVRSPDTSLETQDWFDARWRSMAPADKMAIVDQLTDTCTALALAGIRHLSPEADQRSIRHQLAARRYGPALADEVYGSSTDLDD